MATLTVISWIIAILIMTTATVRFFVSVLPKQFSDAQKINGLSKFRKRIWKTGLATGVGYIIITATMILRATETLTQIIPYFAVLIAWVFFGAVHNMSLIYKMRDEA